jgi:predicted 3-demethylubiquinone-9 3-methyltransferase (glyoxalase superfamily)
MPEITTFLTYVDQAEEAARLYVSIFENGKVVSTSRYGDAGPGPKGSVMSVTFELFGRTFHALNGGPTFSFSQGISLFVSCDTQAEIDRYWSGLTANGGKEVQCGWLVDRFGVSWQIIPKALQPLLMDADPARAGRAMRAMLQMKKLDIAALKRAADGRS